MTQCCDAWGNCTRGEDCPARAAEPTSQDIKPVAVGTPSEGTKSAQAIWIGLKDRALSFARGK